MDEKQRANTTGLPIDDRPEVHQPGRSAPISLEQDGDLREGRVPDERFDDMRMHQPPSTASRRGDK
jgi:hypothetical protein